MSYQATIGAIRTKALFLRRGEGSSVLPALSFLLVVFIVPLALLLPLSVDPQLGFVTSYWKILTDSTFATIIANTFSTAAWVTGIGLLISFPVAWALCVVNEKAAKIALVIIIMSMWSSLLARTYSWLILLQRRGPINHLLQLLGLTDQPIALVNNEIGVVIGMVYIMLPFMIMPIYGAIRKLDPSVLNAVAICGANRLSIFCRVFVPMLRGSIAAGGLIVFVMSLGYYVTPAILGSPQNMMLAQLIAQKVQDQLDWQYATAAAVILLVMTLILYWSIYIRVSGDVETDT